jgi:hypothetical protein
MAGGALTGHATPNKHQRCRSRTKESLRTDLERAVTRQPPAQKRHTLRAHEIATPKVSFAPGVLSALARRRSRAPGTAPAADGAFPKASSMPVESEVVPRRRVWRPNKPVLVVRPPIGEEAHLREAERITNVMPALALPDLPS